MLGERARGSRGSGRRRGDDARHRGGQAMQAGSLVAWRARARAPCPSSAYWHEDEGDREEEVEASGALASTRLWLLAEVEEDQGAPGGLG